MVGSNTTDHTLLAISFFMTSLYSFNRDAIIGTLTIIVLLVTFIAQILTIIKTKNDIKRSKGKDNI